MPLEFYDYLYYGYTGEYQLISSLYRNGLDAVRPPADMGIDVVSLNLKAQLQDPAIAPETFFFQVKTAITSIQTDENGRSIAIAEFKLKDSEIETLCQSADRALVCYVYTYENDALTNSYEAPFCCFWIDGIRLAAIKKHGGLFQRDGDAKNTLRAKLTLPPAENSHWYVTAVDEQNNQIAEGYLGTIDSQNEATSASDGADHYSIAGYLDYARSLSEETNREGEHAAENTTGLLGDQSSTSNREAILAALARRGIRYFVHFTRVGNLQSIFEHGILSPAAMSREGIAYDNTDNFRYDGQSAICLSVEFPNYRMFYSKRCSNPNEHWCVLLLDAEGVVNATHPQYFWTNAASRDFAADEATDNLESAEAFERMFADEIEYYEGNVLKRADDIPDFFTTDAQAEAHVEETIPADLIKVAVFDCYDTYDAYSAELPDGVMPRYGNYEGLHYFNVRCDYDSQPASRSNSPAAETPRSSAANTEAIDEEVPW